MSASTNLTVGGATVYIGADLGYIKDAVTITPTVELFTVDGVEQLLTPAAAWRVSESFECTFTLVEPTEGNINIALDSDNSWAGTPSILEFGDNQFAPTERVLVVTGKTTGATQFVRTISFGRAVLSGPAPIKFTKGEETNLALTFMCLFDEADGSHESIGWISDAAA